MSWQLTDDLAALDQQAGAFLRRDPVAHTVVLGVLAQVATGGLIPTDRPLGAVLHRDGAVAGAAWWTPPYGLGVTDIEPAAAAALAQLLADQRPDVGAAPFVVGPATASGTLARALAERLRLVTAPGLVETLYRLVGVNDLVADPRPVPVGVARPAVPDDAELLGDWWSAFAREAGTVPVHHVDQHVRSRLGSVLVWDDGSARAMASGRETGGGIARIGPVFTPPDARGAGIATALVTALVRHLFAAGADVVTLYADDGNTTSSGIYRRLGFRPVLAWAEHQLRRPGGA